MPKDRFITPEGYPFILIGVVLTGLFALLKWPFFAVLLGSLTLFVCFFFRNPKRQGQAEPEALVAPADGKIISIERIANHTLLQCSVTKVSTFMSVFNCHVNRIPFSGEVKSVSYHPGRFVVASFDKASEENERNSMVLADRAGRKIALVQIAGIIARRIVCYLKEGMEVEKGARLGMIRFGSRVDLFIPDSNFNLNVKKGDSVYAGLSVIGRWV
jgi:phosphatidylserine decarboxylase